ncbi:MAG: hypothetical protein V2B15_02320 [Bacteroidota bacterium]
METFQLTEKELAEMRQFYKEEFNRTSSRLLHIRAILKRLGVAMPENDIEEIRTIANIPGIKAGIKQGAGKRTVRKSKWELLIMKRMRQLNRPVTYEELTDEIMAFSKLPDSKRTSTKQAVVNVVFRLRTRDRKLDTFSMGTREKYIGLKSWFDAKGLIKKEYTAKINAGNRVKKENKRKVGRPRNQVQSS